MAEKSTPAPAVAAESIEPTASLPTSIDEKNVESRTDHDLKDSSPETLVDGDEAPPMYEDTSGRRPTEVLETAKDIVTNVLHVEDDPTINPWTFRMFFLGIGLAIFGSVLQELFYFKPQVVVVSNIFLTAIAYILGEAMAFIIPRKTFIGRFLNPGPFNLKEHAAITLFASSGAVSALATEALAAQSLYYGGYPNKAGGVFIVISSQLLGFGVAGLLREVLVYPTKMLWPISLPISTLLENLHRDKTKTKQQLKVFYIVFFVMFTWEVFPEYIFPLLTGFSIFCLANQKSLVFTNLFGGSQGNEGMGFLSLCLDWNYVASTGSPIWVPLQTLINSYIGYIAGICLFMGLYYGNVWNSLDLPFMSQLLFSENSTRNKFIEFNEKAILTPNKEIDRAALLQTGLPRLTATYLGYLITSNVGFTATFVHMFLWNYDDVKSAWSFLHPSNLKKLLKADTYRFWDTELTEQRRREAANDPNIDPHYKLMLKYKDAPQWWFGLVLVCCFIIGMVSLYVIESTLPWWGFILAIILTAIFLLFFGAQMAITGFQFNQQPIAQMLAGYMFPGRPLANMYFTSFLFNTTQQGQYLLKDLRLAQYVHLSPRAAFTAQILGGIVGALFNYIIMLDVVQKQRHILLSIGGSNIWSGQNVQQFNTLAIAWAIASDMFSIGGKYQWVTASFLVGFVVPLPFYIAHRFFPRVRFFSYINTAVIMWYMGFLFVGVNSSLTTYYLVGFLSQFWVRRYFPAKFAKYNYLVSAALDGGTQVIIFILTFAIFGAGRPATPFPLWAGNNGGFAENKNVDFCAYNTAQ